MEHDFRIEIRQAPKRTAGDRKQYAWHVVNIENGRREGWMGEHNINLSHVKRQVETLFNALARGIEVKMVRPKAQS